VHTNSFRAVRGRSILCAVLDEVVFFRDEKFASPDIEVDAALSPGLARVPGSMKILLLCSCQPPGRRILLQCADPAG
jgi:hypothetical protein